MRKNQTLTFGNISLSDYGCYFSGNQLFRKPQKEVDYYSVIGKNGDLSISRDRYSNITRPINCYITKDFIDNYNNLINILSSLEGYQRFESTEEPDVYMMAQFSNEIQPELWQHNERGTFTLEFNFKPQKWLKSGENAIEITNINSIYNPTQQKALPLIEVEGTGSLQINDSILTLATNTSTTSIDCETQNCYEGTINRNGDLTISNGFPTLISGENTIVISGFTKVLLYPKWWRL